jgi:hypothetical protein
MRNNVVRYPSRRDEPPEDPIFFAKHQLRVGTPLRFWGRTGAGELWFVMRVYSNKDGTPRSETFPQTLDDLIQLRNHETGRVRYVRFLYLSYSSIWRIDV